MLLDVSTSTPLSYDSTWNRLSRAATCDRLAWWPSRTTRALVDRYRVTGASFAISEYDVITSPEPLSYAAYASFLLSEPRPSRRSLSAPAGVAAAGAAAAALFVAAATASSRRSNFGRRQRDDAPALV